MLYHTVLFFFFCLGFNPACLNEAVELGYNPLALSRGSYLLALPFPEAGCVQSGRIPYLATRHKAFTTIVLSTAAQLGAIFGLCIIPSRMLSRVPRYSSESSSPNIYRPVFPVKDQSTHNSLPSLPSFS